MARITYFRPTRRGLIITAAIIVLAIILGVGLYMVKQQGDQARREDAMKVAEQQLKDQSNQGVALNQGRAENNSSNNSQNQSQTQDQSQNQNQSQAQSNANSTNNGAGQGGASQLPQTGPEDALPIVAAGALTFAGVAYLRSRRALLSGLN